MGADAQTLDVWPGVVPNLMFLYCSLRAATLQQCQMNVSPPLPRACAKASPFEASSEHTARITAEHLARHLEIAGFVMIGRLNGTWDRVRKRLLNDVVRRIGLFRCPGSERGAKSMNRHFAAPHSSQYSRQGHA